MIKIKQFLIIICLVCILSGCTINYNLYFDTSNSCKEELIINNFDTNNASGISYGYFVNRLKNELGEKYTINQKNNSNMDIEVYTNFSKYKALEYSNILKNYAYNISSGNGKIEIEPNIEYLDYIFYVPSEDGDGATNYVINVNIDIPYKVTSTNADKSSNNIFTWIINKDNYTKNIELEYDKSNIVKKNNNDSSNSFNIISLIIVIVLMVAAIFILKIYKKYSINQNIT